MAPRMGGVSEIIPHSLPVCHPQRLTGHQPLDAVGNRLIAFELQPQRIDNVDRKRDAQFADLVGGL